MRVAVTIFVTVIFIVAVCWIIASLPNAHKPQMCNGPEKFAIKACSPWWFDNR